MKLSKRLLVLADKVDEKKDFQLLVQAYYLLRSVYDSVRNGYRNNILADKIESFLSENKRLK
jgi:hypothetical protein